jgi:hypothetical protein
MIRRLLIATAAALAIWAAFGAVVLARRAPRAAPPRGELRGAWHVHTTHSDGLGTLAEVVAAARDAGLQFVVVTDHNVLTPEEQGWHDGVLVVEGTEASTAFGHVAAVGVPRALTPEERDGDPLRAIAALGGQAIVAHPFHPRRPFTGWGRGAWRGLEIVSNDTAWGELMHDRAVGKAALAAAVLPFDGARAVLALQDDPADELSRFDAELTAARARGEKGPARVLLCSADAHGYPSYGAAFRAFSMHLPLVPSGDGAADARAVAAALVDGSAACVFDGVAPAAGVRLEPASGGTGLELRIDAPDLRPARFSLVRDGTRVAERTAPVPGGRAVVAFPCGGAGRCPPGDYRVEGTFDGRAWIFTNPLRIE